MHKFFGTVFHIDQGYTSIIKRRAQKKQGLSKSIQHALDVLEWIATYPSDVGITQIAEALHLPKSTAHRILLNLQARGLVERDPVSERYRAGLQLFALGTHAVDKTALRGNSHLYLEELVKRVGETGYLAVLDRDEVLYIDSIEGPRALRAAAPNGTRRPIYCTAVGKALVAYADEGALHRLVFSKPMVRRAPKTITEPEAFRSNLAQVRRDGYAVDVEEFEEGLVCMAAQILDSSGRVVAAIGLTGPIWRLMGERVKSTLKALRLTSDAISGEMGYHNAPRQRAAGDS